MDNKDVTKFIEESAYVLHEMVDENGKFLFHYFSTDPISITSDKEKIRPRKFTRSNLRRLLENPVDNIDSLQSASEYFFITNGQYQRMIRYSASYYTYDHILYPIIDQKKFEQTDKLWIQYDKNALYLEKINPKALAWSVVLQLLKTGETYLYKVEDKKSIIFKELPSTYCRISHYEDGVYRFAINLSKLTETVASELPEEIYNEWTANRNRKGKDRIEWYPVSENGIAFNYFGARSKGYPPFSYLFESLSYYLDALDSYEDQTELDGLKLIHQKIPLDDQYRPVLNRDQIQGYHDATKKGLPKLMTIVTNPFEVNALNFEKTASLKKDFVEQAESSIYDNSGFSKQLFNNTLTSGEGLKKSIIADQSSIRHIIDMVESYLNYELKKINKAYPFGVKILDTTVFNIEDRHTKAREDLAYGGSRLMFLATQNLEPLEAINILRFEQAVGLDEYFVPASTSHTQSNTGDNTKDEVTDAGDVSREYD